MPRVIIYCALLSLAAALYCDEAHGGELSIKGVVTGTLDGAAVEANVEGKVRIDDPYGRITLSVDVLSGAGRPPLALTNGCPRAGCVLCGPYLTSTDRFGFHHCQRARSLKMIQWDAIVVSDAPVRLKEFSNLNFNESELAFLRSLIECPQGSNEVNILFSLSVPANSSVERVKALNGYNAKGINVTCTAWTQALTARSSEQAEWLANSILLFVEGKYPAAFGRKPQVVNEEFFSLWLRTNTYDALTKVSPNKAFNPSGGSGVLAK